MSINFFVKNIKENVTVITKKGKKEADSSPCEFIDDDDDDDDEEDDDEAISTDG